MICIKLLLENPLSIRPCNCEAASEPLLPKVARCIPVLPSRYIGSAPQCFKALWFNSIRSGLFSRSPGSDSLTGQKFKVKINRLKWNFARVIIAIKPCLMKNLRLVAFLFLEIWRHKISLWRGEQVIEFSYLSLENGFSLKRWVFMSRIILLDPKLTPMSISEILK